MLMKALEIIAGSWPIAVMVVGVSIALVVRRSIKQAMDNDREAKRDRAMGNQAVVVRDRASDEG
jgi:NADH:ubiquinone oxidoreductase subunit F (NADH-binding)